MKKKIVPLMPNKGNKSETESDKGKRVNDSFSYKLWKPHDIHRHDQVNRLERFYKQFGHPSQIQKGTLTIELGLKPKQIEFWFHDKKIDDMAQDMKREQEFSELRARMCEKLEKQNRELRTLMYQKLGYENCELTSVERFKLDCMFPVKPIDNYCIDIGVSNMVMLGNKVMKSYSSIFSLFGTTDFLQSSEKTNANVQIGFRKNTCLDYPIGIVIHAASSVRVSASPEKVLSYLNDPFKRYQWDVFFKTGGVRERVKIPLGDHPSNVISILEPSNSLSLAVLQETMAVEMASFLVYAPVSSSAMLRLYHGSVIGTVPVLASGFRIAPHGSGSVITVAFQLLASTSTEDGVSMDIISKVKNLVNDVVNAIKPVFN